MTANDYQNPILCADYSDPDIVRVGDDFFMVSSSFNHMPALPILHSTDLVSWKIINHVFNALPLAGFHEYQPGKGVWAPSIRWHDNKLWVFFSTPDEGIFMCHTDDPWGAWSEPHCLQVAKGWIDPCPFWDDNGEAWLVHAFAHSRSGIKHKLQLFSMSPDGKQLQGEGRIIYDGSCDQPTLEGPKVYKRGGWYYIFAPAGGVETGWETVLRAKSMQGPWEAKNVLFQGNTPVNGPHQGGWVELDDGECWFVHFQDAHLYGRIVHLQPMCWGDDGWPRIGEPLGENGEGQPVMRGPRPVSLPASPREKPQTSDDFANGKPGLQWQWQANPNPEWLLPGKQQLNLHCCGLPSLQEKNNVYWVPNLLLQKFPAWQFSAQTSLTLNAEKSGDAGGVIVYGERYASLLLENSHGRYRILWVTGWMSDAGIVSENRQAIAVIDDASCEMKIEVSLGGICRFAWRQNDSDWYPIAQPFAAGKGKWVGAKIGLLALSLESTKSDGFCAFDHFALEITG
ncbi:glycoside hydrolase 43 family protein [Kluyvera cryocrescens]|uniref:Glycoside hydrolase 43 family protein n=1 Tax=Kluyvera cryocrescens TaxID=580 RepID=A0AAW9C4A0_KLUCR|nr:glycoside hydrolase 43 family protein [Kluyvera cryocrescens]MDW3776340.1 glycoside hydrolase 43 family protein [Kluyvera cryocrescens]MEB6633856.1 glycoside hydrolase 43 family protein [Kluyvera cryocrescens]MEB7556342.1 glycoside hydrolase 43 family protein [Kluyvera cryocrescens]SQC32658.1 Beta-xylosidase [Kluyvera cryocrescens]HDG1673232.1 glycoside hydrolase 43 family protein [Kluyvera cryocrescens]